MATTRNTWLGIQPVLPTIEVEYVDTIVLDGKDLVWDDTNGIDELYDLTWECRV